MLFKLLDFLIRLVGGRHGAWSDRPLVIGSFEHRPRLDLQRRHIRLLVPRLEKMRLAHLLLQQSGPKGTALRLWLKCVLAIQCIARDLTVQAADRLLAVVSRFVDVKRLHRHVVEHVAVALREMCQHLLDL